MRLPAAHGPSAISSSGADPVFQPNLPCASHLVLLGWPVRPLAANVPAVGDLRGGLWMEYL